MLKQSEPTSSTLQLVASDMTGIMEKLDTHELDLDDGEYDTTDIAAPGVVSPSGLASNAAVSRLFPVTSVPVCRRAFALQGPLSHSGVQGARGQSLPVVSDHRQDPGGGALHLSSGPLLRHHAEEHQQGDGAAANVFDVHKVESAHLRQSSRRFGAVRKTCVWLKQQKQSSTAASTIQEAQNGFLEE